MSAKACAPDDVFDKYCAELSVPRLITTWSIEMSKQQLVETLSNRGYRFDLNQFSAYQLLQLLRESDVLYHQVKKDGNESEGESNTAAKVMNEKSKRSEQNVHRSGSGTSKTQVHPENNISSPLHSFEDQPVSRRRERVETFQDGPGRQAVAESSRTTRSGPKNWEEGQKEAKGGDGKSEPAEGERSESDMQRTGKRKMTEKEIGGLTSPPLRSAPY